MNRELDRNQRKALGKGLSALLPARPSPSTAPPLPAEPNGAPVEDTTPSKSALPDNFEEFQNIPLTQLFPSGEQPRRNFDGQKLMELSQSIRAHGVLQPITVYKVAPDKYKIIAGERRWQAAGIAGLKEMPALVRIPEEEKKRLELALIENIQREDLNPIEIAIGFDRLAEDHGMSHDQIAARTGKDRSTVTNLLRLLRLSPHVRNELERGTITAGHARALLNITDDRSQARACEEVMTKQLSVRATEELVKRLTKPTPPQREPRRIDPNVKAAVEELERALGTKVRLIERGKGGRIEIDYYSQDDLDRIYSVIVSE